MATRTKTSGTSTHCGESTRRGRLTTLMWKRPRCPECDGVRLAKYRSIADQGDGTALAWVRCARCGEKFRVIYE